MESGTHAEPSAASGMFAAFEAHESPTERGTIHAMVGGGGPPLLLLHGYPQTHLMWHAAAPLLAERLTVVAADLSRVRRVVPPRPRDHAPHSKRALAADQVQAMAALGYDRFAVAGHDRGGRVAYRMALDHPDRVSAAGGPRHRAHGRGLGAGRPRAGPRLLALGVPRPGRAVARAAHRRRPATPSSTTTCALAGLGAEPERYPDEVMAAYRAPAGRPQRGRRDVRGLPRRRHDRPGARRRRSGRATSHVRSCPVGAPRRASARLRRRARRLAPVGPRRQRRGLDASHFLVEDRRKRLRPGCSRSSPTPDPVRFSVRAVRRRGAGCGADRLPDRGPGWQLFAPCMRRRRLDRPPRRGGGELWLPAWNRPVTPPGAEPRSRATRLLFS